MQETTALEPAHAPLPRRPHLSHRRLRAATNRCAPAPAEVEAAATEDWERPAPSSAAERAGSHCAEGEAVAFSCTISGKTASVCVGAATVNYRYGPLGAPELQIASTGADGLAHGSSVIGQGVGGVQRKVRFSNGGHEYIVYVMRTGELSDVPGRFSAGVTVAQGETIVASLRCPDVDSHQFERFHVPAEGDPDERYADGWW